MTGNRRCRFDPDRRTAEHLLSWLPAVVLAILAHLPAARGAEAVDFARDIRPIFVAHCVECHGAENVESGLRLDRPASIAEGGNTGPAIVAGASAASLIIQRIRAGDPAERMPPEDHGPPLGDAEIALLARWIDAGAAMPDEDPSTAPRQPVHWSFQPVERPSVPETARRHWSRTPIDAFVLEKLDRQKLAPSPQAPRAALIRRLSFDLRGLPPSPREVDRFVADRHPDAYQRLVDRYLATPQFGERWARQWLDFARYADSDGYTNDMPRSIWPYRDWVIDAINRDLPFDAFVIDQIAGDLRPGATVAQRVATGFHRNTQHNREGGSDPEQYRVERVVDRVTTTAEVFLGLTFICARCHDHKYDPISQREFYQFYAFFNQCDEPTYSLPSPAQRKQLEAINAKIAAAKRRIEAARSDEARDRARSGLKRLEAERKTLESHITTTLVVRQRAEPRTTHVLLRGDFLRPGRVVSAGVPAVLPPLPGNPAHPTRMDLARWLVAPDQPLTPRVTVNHLWQALFGLGLVETENDFGTQGSPPSHPRLLDWLAAELRDGGWSRKRLLRQIVGSSVYRQQSARRPELDQVDPRNRLLARQSRHRLDAEMIRDAALAASGLLCLDMRGPGVHPPQPAGVMALARTPNRKWIVSRGGDRYRRGLYTYFWRGTPYPFLKTFDAPDSNRTCTRRDRSNTPLQALTLLNDQVFVEAAEALAARLLREAPRGEEQRLLLAFRLCLGREPTGAERRVFETLVRAERREAASGDHPPPTPALARMPSRIDPSEQLAWISVARVLLNVDEFMTRE